MKESKRLAGAEEMRQVLAVQRPWFVRCLGYAWLGGLLVLVSTVYMFEVYDRVVNSRNVMTLLMLTGLVLGAYALMEVLETMRLAILRAVGQNVDAQFSGRLQELARRMARQDRVAAAQRVLDDFRVLRELLTNPVLGAIMEAPLSLVFLLILFVFHPWLGWVALLGAAAQVGITLWSERSSRQRLMAANQAAGAAQASLQETLQQHEVAAAMGMQAALYQRWAHWQGTLIAQQASASVRAGLAQAAGKFLQTALGSALLGLSAFLLLQDQLPGGGGLMIVASVLGGRVLAPLLIVVSQWRSVAQALQAWQRLAEALTHFAVAPDSMRLPAPRGHLVVDRVAVAPPNSPSPVLRDVRVNLPAGQCLGVIGPSGAGKSSLLRALVGYWPCVQGHVRLDGVDIAQWDKAELGPHVGYLPQDVVLLEGSVGENVGRFEASADQDADTAEALRWVGWPTDDAPTAQWLARAVGPRGSFLSGGQRARVGLARAIYRYPKLVVLDEPSAHLDEAGERQVQALIAHLKQQGCTVVVSTHRTTLLDQTDQLLLLRDGSVQAYGPTAKVIEALQQALASAKQGLTA